MKVSLSGTRNGKEWPQRGSVIDLPEDEALSYVRSGMAEAVAEFPAPVNTATPPTETVEKRGPKPAAEKPKSGLTKSDVPGF
jgi:hypothetical protein